MTESEKFTLERFIKVNVEFYNEYRPYVLSVALKLVDMGIKSSYRWRLQFDYDMQRRGTSERGNQGKGPKQPGKDRGQNGEAVFQTRKAGVFLLLPTTRACRRCSVRWPG